MDQKTLETKLLDSAWLAESRAYAPYSKFKVGSAIYSKKQIFIGCNVENASYGLTVCAERHAIAQAVVAQGLERGSLDAVMVAVKSDRATFPCGACRQVLNEFGHAETIIYLSIKPGEVHQSCLLSELLPHAFGPKDLGG